MRDYILIGGSRDGQRITLEIPRGVLQIPVMRPIVMYGGVPEVETEIELYFLRELAGRDETQVVYAIQDMGIDAVLAKLIDGYGRQ